MPYLGFPQLINCCKNASHNHGKGLVFTFLLIWLFSVTSGWLVENNKTIHIFGTKWQHYISVRNKNNTFWYKKGECHCMLTSHTTNLHLITISDDAPRQDSFLLFLKISRDLYRTSTINSTVHAIYLNSSEHYVCITTMANIQSDRESSPVPLNYECRAESNEQCVGNE